MKAYVCQQREEKVTLVEADLSQPLPGPHEIVVSVRAEGVTPTELLWYPTTHKKDGTSRADAVPGHEFSGEISAVGECVSTFHIGDPVFGMSDWFENGATADRG